MAVTDLGPTQLKNIDRADPGLFAASRRPGPGEARDASRTRRAKKALLAGAARRWDRRLAHRPRGRGMVAPRSEPACGRRNEVAGAGRVERYDARPKPGISPSWCCRSPIFQTTLPKIISLMESQRTLTTDLSRLSGAFVIARNTAFTFKGKNVDAREIGKELGVRYVLEGSVQRDAGRMRVNVQLIDAETGNHLWADRFDKPLADLFEMQDEIVARLANQLGTELISAEARRGATSGESQFDGPLFSGYGMVQQGN